MSSQSEEDLEEARVDGHAAGVAEERARCLLIVSYEGWNHGAGDEPEDIAQRMGRSIELAIRSGKPGSKPPT